MERYRPISANSFVYEYNMPREIDLSEPKPIKKKRKVVNILFKRCKNNKNSAVISYTDSSNTNNKQIQKYYFDKANCNNNNNNNTKIKLHDKRHRLDLNCCKIS